MKQLELLNIMVIIGLWDLSHFNETVMVAIIREFRKTETEKVFSGLINKAAVTAMGKPTLNLR